MEPNWLAEKFSRSGLPRGDLARYLGVDNAAISRAMRGKRNLNERERREAEAFFSVVPDEVDELYRRAVRRLRAPSTRARAAGALARWLRRYPSSGGMVATVLQQGSAARADQIVAIARAEGLDLPVLIATGEVQAAAGVPARAPLEARDPDARLAAATRTWVPDAATLYHLNFAGEDERAARPPERAAWASELREVEPPWLSVRQAYAVTDDTLMPRFERGNVILFEEEGVPAGRSYERLRPNDMVAAVLAREGGRVRAIVGRLIACARSSVIVQPVNGCAIELPIGEVVAVLRAIGVVF